MMDTQRMQQTCAGLAGAERHLQGPPANVLVYKVGGKPFAYFKTSEPEAGRFSLRVSADRFLELTDVPGIKPARYMGRFHWVTIVHLGCLPEDYLLELLAWSHQRALASLSKTRRIELTGQSAQ